MNSHDPNVSEHEMAIEKLLERRREIDSALGQTLDDVSPAGKFGLFTDVNKRKALEDGADLEEVAERCFFTAEDLYDHYAIANEYESFSAFVADRALDDDELAAYLESSDE